MTGRPGRRHRPRGDDGSLTLFAVVVVFALLVVAGLVVDGGATLTATRRANHLAEQAARAGAQAADTTALHTGAVRLDPTPARAAALAYLHAAARPGTRGTAPYDVTVTVGPDAVTVALHTTTTTAFLGLLGIHTLPGHRAGPGQPAAPASPRSSHDHHPAARPRPADPTRGRAPRRPAPSSRAAAGTWPAPPAPPSPWPRCWSGCRSPSACVGGQPAAHHAAHPRPGRHRADPPRPRQPAHPDAAARRVGRLGRLRPRRARRGPGPAPRPRRAPAARPGRPATPRRRAGRRRRAGAAHRPGRPRLPRRRRPPRQPPSPPPAHPGRRATAPLDHRRRARGRRPRRRPSRRRPPRRRPAPVDRAPVYVVQPPHARPARDPVVDRRAAPRRPAALARDRRASTSAAPSRTGARMTDPHWIRPGWELLLPADAVLPTTTPAGPAAVAAPPRTAAGRHARPAGASPQPGAAQRTTPSTADATPTAVARPPELPEPTAPDNAGDADRPAIRSPDLLTLLGAGLLAAGIGTVLARARIVQRRHRPTGSPVPRPARRAAARGVPAAGPRRAGRPRLPRHRAAQPHRPLTRATPRPPPALLGARLTAPRLELHLAEPAPSAPAPFTATDDGRTWVVDHDAALPLSPATAGTVPAPYPGLVPLGHDPDGLVLLDLLTHRTVAVTGPHEQALDVLRWAAAELAVSDLGDDPHVTLVGFGAELVPLRPRTAHPRRGPHPGPAAGPRPARWTFTQPGSAVFLLLAQPPDDAASRELDELRGRPGRARGPGRRRLGRRPHDAAGAPRRPARRRRRRRPRSPVPPAPRRTGSTSTRPRPSAALVDSARTPQPHADPLRPRPAGLVVTEPPRPPEPRRTPRPTKPPEPDHEPTSDDELDAAVAAFLDPEDTTVPKVAVPRARPGQRAR